MIKFNARDFQLKKREPLLMYDIYEFNFDEMMQGFEIVRQSIVNRDAGRGTKLLYKIAIQLNQRADDSLTYLLNCYSGGHDLKDVADLYPTILWYWETYLEAWKAYLESSESSNKTVAAIPLLNNIYFC